MGDRNNYGLRKRANDFVDQRFNEGDYVEIDREEFVELIALAMAKGKYGDRAVSVDYANGTARSEYGYHFDGRGQGADASRY